MNSHKKKVKPSIIVSYVILSLLALIIVVPFFWFISTSFDYVKSYSLRFPPRMLPKVFSTFNYNMALTNVPVLSYLKKYNHSRGIKRCFQCADVHRGRFCDIEGPLSGERDCAAYHPFQI